MEDRLKGMKALDERMYKDSRDYINFLIIIAGIFSITATRLTIESYKYTHETPANTLARLQLRDLLAAIDDPAIDRLAPTTFKATPSSVLVHALFFTSLALALTVFFVGILCKQWLHEYEKCDSFAAKKFCIFRGLRYPGLRAGRVRRIITVLSHMILVAHALVFIGLHVWIWSLLPAVVFIVFTVPGLTVFLLLCKAVPRTLPSNSTSTQD